jgi:hypothetical protein
MAVTHYGYLVLKMPSSNGVQKFVDTAMPASLRWRSSRIFTAQHEAAAGPDSPVKVIQIRANAAQRTHITGDLDSK